MKPRVNLHHAIPHSAMTACQHGLQIANSVTPPPTQRLSTPVRWALLTLRDARRSPEAQLRRAAYKKELRTLESFGTLLAAPRASVHPGARVVRAVTTFTYKYDETGCVKAIRPDCRIPETF